MKRLCKNLTSLLLFTILLNVNLVQADLTLDNQGLLLAKENDIPDIDGNVELSEWNGGGRKTIKLFGREDPSYSLDIIMQAMFNDTVKELYLAVTIPQEAIGPLNYFTIYFQTNKDEPLLDIIDDKLTVAEHNDIKELYLNTNSASDSHSSGHEITKWPDSIKNIDGNCLDSGSELTLEMKIPFISNDTEGEDIFLTKGMETNFFIFYMNTLYSNESTAYYQYNEQSGMCEICTLKIDGKIERTAFIIISLIPFIALGIASISFYEKK